MMHSIVRRLGQSVLSFFEEIGTLSVLFHRIVRSTGYAFRHRKILVDQMLSVGIRSLPLVTVVSVFTGAVSAWQAAYQFEGIFPGALTYDFLGAAVSAAIFIELSPVLVGLVLAGRMGASIAAELGTMGVTEQLDALESLAIDPIRFLAAPRFTAGWIMLPVLVIYSNVVAHAGACGVAVLLLNMSASTFFDSVQSHFLAHNAISGIIKASVFGGGTALIGCSIGFRTRGGAEGVGQATIKAFVYSSAFILVTDYLLAMVLF